MELSLLQAWRSKMKSKPGEVCCTFVSVFALALCITIGWALFAKRVKPT